jgi:hypothetical protein
MDKYSNPDRGIQPFGSKNKQFCRFVSNLVDGEATKPEITR